MSGLRFNQIRHAAQVLVLLFALPGSVKGQAKNPVLNNVFPPGGQAGSTVEVVAHGSDLDGLTSIICSCAGVTFRPIAEDRFAAVIPADAPTGSYDIRVVGVYGVSSPQTFVVGSRPELIESSANNDSAAPVAKLNSVVNGRVEKNGDVDTFRFDAHAGNRLIIDCRAERMDSRLRAVLELFDPSGRRVATSRGYFGIDPLIDFRVPTDGAYMLKIYDRTYTGSDDHFYRLSIDAGPRVLFAFPSTVAVGSTSRVTLYGWNLTMPQPGLVAANDRNVAKGEFGEAGNDRSVTTAEVSPALGPDPPFDRIEVDVTAPKPGEHYSVPLLLRSGQASLDVFAYRYPGSDEPINSKRVMKGTGIRSRQSAVKYSGSKHLGSDSARPSTSTSTFSMPTEETSWPPFMMSCRTLGDADFPQSTSMRRVASSRRPMVAIWSSFATSSADSMTILVVAID
jgi:hypothetical protein